MNSQPTLQVDECEASPVLLEGAGCSSSNRPTRVDSHAVHEQLLGGSSPLLTVIVPVYNEAATIDRLLALTLQAPYPKQIIVVDDASSDNSAELLRKWAQSGHIELLQHTRNQGKGAAIRTGLACARGCFLIIQDADLEYDPQDYRVVIEPLLNGVAEVVYGSRRLGTRPSWRQWLNPFYHGVRMLNICVRLLYGVRITDEATCYKAFRTSTLRSMDLICERFEFCPEVTAKACRMGLRIVEVPIRYMSRRVRDGKKIGVRDALEAVRTLWHWRRWNPDLHTGEPLASMPRASHVEFPDGAARGERLPITAGARAND